VSKPSNISGGTDEFSRSLPPSLPLSLPPQVFFRYYPERVQTLEYFGWKWWWPSLEEGEEAEAPQPYNRYNNFEGMDLVLKLNVRILPSLPPSLPPFLPGWFRVEMKSLK